MILIRCGLRISDTVTLPQDCIIRDKDGAPYLRYLNHKMKREALVPIDEVVERAGRCARNGRLPDCGRRFPGIGHAIRLWGILSPTAPGLAGLRS